MYNIHNLMLNTHDDVLDRYKERLADSGRRNRTRSALQKKQVRGDLYRTLMRVIKHDGDARQLMSELPALIREVEEKLTGIPRACEDCSSP